VNARDIVLGSGEQKQELADVSSADLKYDLSAPIELLLATNRESPTLLLSSLKEDAALVLVVREL
jgi:hypothetical protein